MPCGGTCPNIKYGVPSAGAYEYDVNTGRELFRCGLSCVKMFITNVSVEKRLVKFSCADVSDALAGEVCLQNVTATARDQGVVNWIAKDGVTSGLDSGSVITKVDTECIAASGGGGSCGAIYTHTEGNLTIRVVANLEDVTASREDIKNRALQKLTLAIWDELDWIFSDVGINASPTDWQGGSVTYLGFGCIDGGGCKTYRETFNWQNGRLEIAEGTVYYDTSDDKDLGTIINSLAGI